MSPTELVLPVRQHLVLRRSANGNTKGSRGVGWGVDVRKDVGRGGEQMGRMHATNPRGSVRDSKLNPTRSRYC